MPYRSKKISKRPFRKSLKKSPKKSLKKSPKKSLKKSPKRPANRSSKKSPKRSLKRPANRSSKKSPKRSLKRPANRSPKRPLYTLHTVGTYNMSFASDLGLDPTRADVYESEGSFLLSNNSGDPRKFWKNSLEDVIYFWKLETNHNPSFLGLQEINKTAPGSETGSGMIEKKLQELNPNLFTLTEEIKSGKSKPALCCIWDTKKLGGLVKKAISNLKPDSGRPFLMVYTTKGYLLVVLHGPHNLLDFRKNLNDKISEFSKDLKLYSDRIFIAGDFNDKYDAIRAIHITPNQEKFTLKYKGLAPKSCCHNWNSSCSDSRYTPLLHLPGREDIGTCSVPIDPVTQKPYPLAGPGKRTPMGPEGDIPNYRYYGDKVFGQSPVTNIQTLRKVNNVRPDLWNTSHSKESDHEMVVCTFKSEI
jgi:hypothetical protein